MRGLATQLERREMFATCGQAINDNSLLWAVEHSKGNGYMSKFFLCTCEQHLLYKDIFWSLNLGGGGLKICLEYEFKNIDILLTNL